MTTRRAGSGPVIAGPWSGASEPAEDPTTPAPPVPLARRGDAEHAVPVATHVVGRPRLHALLDRAVADAAVTLVVGPAGWGKTLLASSWLAAGAGGREAAWVTLGPGHDDPRAFWGALARAVGAHAGPTTAAALHRLAGRQPADPDELPAAFAHALWQAERPVVLVLDDLHEVTAPAVHEGLRSLVERPVPSLALVATTRHDPPWPLTRLRLAGVLAEIRPEDLAFRDDEAGALFAQLGVPAADGHVTEMVARTGGWAAGMRLAALDLATRPDAAGIDAAVAAFSGDAHSVSTFLLDEVLDRQPPELAAFLERISVVDLVCADLADAITGDGDGAARLAELSAAHLFVQALDHPGRWYRLHRLVLDVLRARAVPRRERRERHRRAAEWFRGHGMPLEGLRSAVHGELWALAGEIVGAHLAALVLRGSADAVIRVLGDIPEPVVLARPELATALAGARVAIGESTQVRSLLAAARRSADGIGENRRRRLDVHHALIEAAHARVRGDLEAVTRAFRSVTLDVATLDRWGVREAAIVPAVVLANLGTAELWTGDLAAAEGHLRETADGPGPTTLPRVNAASHLALLFCEYGELDAAELRARAVAEVAEDAGWARMPQVAPAYLTLARVTVDRDELGAAEVWLARLAEVEEVAPEPHVRLAYALALAARLDAAGGREAALVRLRAGSPDRSWTPPRPLAEQWLLGEADLLARAGNPAAARAVADRLGPPRTDGGRVAAARLALHLGDEGVAGVLGDAVASPLPRVRADAGVVAALAAERDGAPDRAAALLEDALLTAAPDGRRRPFLAEPGLADPLRRRVDHGSGAAGFAMDLLERLTGRPAEHAASRVPLAEPLTEREATMLRYLASTLSNPEIAAELYVSVNTVKTHQRAVYRKLGAAGRREAVRRARALGLL
ncbi:LuxR C-terminal-related transcriptional regulator [Actinomycetospora flava]|uniref:LuxR C-terminal-related transcriptional regulator n=1 Tax=Actinomycetospora flava TaxID=3129232 RepID=A0ABU8M4J6_9PSEU